MKRLPLLLFAPVLSAALAALSLPPFDLHLLAWIALVPLLLALRQGSLAAGAGLGLLFGYAFGAGSFFWMNGFPSMNGARFMLLATLFALYYLVFGLLYALANRRLGSWTIACAPVLWVALEYARGSLSFLSAPWNFLGHSQHQALPVLQIADLTGAYGVSYVLLMTNQFVSELAERRSLRQLRFQGAALGLVLAGTLIYGWSKLAHVPKNTGTFRVSLVQANAVSRGKMTEKDLAAHLGAYGRLTLQAKEHKPELIVWPSSSLPGPIEFWVIRLYVNDVAAQAGVPLLVGGAGGDKFAPEREGRLPYSNSEFLISPAGQIEGQYNKIRLTPFTEEVPLQGRVKWPRWLTTLDRSFVPGDGYTLFKVGQARFGAPICWENTFPNDFRRFVLDGANFMVSVTNESVFGKTAGPYQTLAMNVFRAIENRVAIARTATTGVSAFIDSRGRIVSRVKDDHGADLFVAGILTWDVPLAQERSFYTLHGDLFAQVVAGAAMFVVLLSTPWRAGNRINKLSRGSFTCFRALGSRQRQEKPASGPRLP